jgi:hypothetical protein
MQDGLQKLISIDINLDYRVPEGREMASRLMYEYPNFRVVEANSRSVLKPAFFSSEYPDGVDWALIDGDHSYGGVTQDLLAVCAFLNHGGLLIIDDYKSGPPNGVSIESVNRGVDDFLADRREAFVVEVWEKHGKGMCILRRTNKKGDLGAPGRPLRSDSAFP